MSWPLFILAPPRSFTSVACAMIGNHPEMLGLPETNLLAAATYGELTRVYRDRPRFQHGLLRAVAELQLGGQTEENVRTARAWLEEQRDTTTADLFRDIMGWAAPRHVVDKSPMYVYAGGALERMQEEFPDARYLHLTRDPRGTCESIQRTRQVQEEAGVSLRGAGVTVDRMWLKPHVRIMEALEILPADQYMLLRGELLLAEPRLYLPQIAEWLGISRDDEAIDAMLHPEQSPFAFVGPPNAPFGNDPEFLKSPALRPYQPKPADLDSPMSWDRGETIGEAARMYATHFGY